MSILIMLAIAAVALLAVAAVGRPSHMTVAERLIYRLLQFAAWLETVGTALDAALLRYRMERSVVMIELASTRQRESE
jgi:hypothetical protein